MKYRAVTGVLLAAGLWSPLTCAQTTGAVDPTIDSAGLHWFRLGETRQEVVRLLGPPKLSSPFGADFEGWQFQIGEMEEGEFSHHVVFRVSDGKLVSVAREYAEPVNVDRFFPQAETSTFKGASGWSVRVRPLGQGRYLMAMGVSKPGDRTTQIVLLAESALRAFYPWLFEMTKSPR